MNKKMQMIREARKATLEAKRGIQQESKEEEIEDASELEYQEKTTRKKRSYTRRKKDDN